MILGGDYTGAQTAQQCAQIVRAEYGSSTPCVLVCGNHDEHSADFPKGLVYDGNDYAVYVMDSSGQSFLLPILLIYPGN